MIQFEYPGEPVPASRARVTSRGTFNPPEYTAYKKGLALALRARFEVPVANDRAKYCRENRYRLVVDAYRSNRRGVDVDNLAKSVMDALQESGLLMNDNQVDELICRKHLGADYPRVVFILERV